MGEKQKVPEQTIKKVILYAIFSLSLIYLASISQNFVQKESLFPPIKTFVIPFIIIMLILMWVISIISLTAKDKDLAIPALIYFLTSSGIIIYTHPQNLIMVGITYLLILFGSISSQKLEEGLVKIDNTKTPKSFMRTIRIAIIVTCFLISLGITIYTRSQYLIGPLVTFLLVLLGFTKSQTLKDDLIRINVIKTSRPVIKNLRISISILISLTVLFSYSKTPASELNIGEKVVEMIGPSIDKMIEQESTNIITRHQNTNLITDSNVNFMLSDLGISQDINTDLPYQIQDNISNEIKEGIKSQLSRQINRRVEPYKDVLFPAIVVLSFLIIQICSYISYFVYLLTMNIIVGILKKTGFLKLEIKQVEKENIVL
jgi:Tfp pilus assembly protein PilZ